MGRKRQGSSTGHLPSVSALAGGVVSVLVQGMVLRSALFGQNQAELASGLVFAGWLACSGIGAAVGGRLRRKREAWIGGILTISLVGILQSIPFLSGSVPFPLLVLPAGFAAGVIFVQPFGYSPAKKVYALEAAGACIGGALFIVLSPVCLAVGLFIACSLTASLALFMIRSWIPAAAVLAVTMLLLLTGIAEDVQTWLNGERFSAYGTSELWPSPYGEIAITERDGQFAAFRSGVLETYWPAPEPAEERIAIPLLVSLPERVLYIGSSPEETSILEGWPGIESLKVLVPDKALLDAIPGYPEGASHGDGRAYLSGTDSEYDLIVVSTGAPLSLLANRFFTAEFLAAAGRRLTGEGVLVLYLQGGENRLSRGEGKLCRSVLLAGEELFDWHRALPTGGVTLLFGNGREKSTRGGVLARRLDSLGVNLIYMSEGAIPFELTDTRIAALEQQICSEDAQENRDLAPAGFRYASANWAVRMGKGSSNSAAIVAGLTIGFALLLITAKLSGKASLMLSYGVLGLSGLAVETVAIVAIQATLGYSWTMLGAVTGLFMAGMAAGALLPGGKSRYPLLTAQLLAVCSAGAGGTLVILYGAGSVGPQLLAVLFLILTAVAGMSGGAGFTAAASMLPGLGTRPLGLLSLAGYSGSALGAILSPLVLFPLLGGQAVLFLVCGAVLLTLPFVRRLGY